MTIKQKGDEKPPPEKPVIYHFTEDDEKRYCTRRPKGNDELTRDRSKVKCTVCLEDLALEDKPELFEKFRKKMKE